MWCAGRNQHRGVPRAACRVDRVAGSVDAIGRVVQHIAVEVYLDQVGRRDLVIHQAVGVDQDLVVLARDPRRDMVEVEVCQP